MGSQTVGGRPPARRIRRILIANRGEIAARILSTLREYHHPLEIFTLATAQDTGHTLHSTHVIELSEAAAYLDVDYLVGLAKKHSIDAIHPGYGFLSESSEFARRAWTEAGATVIGPGWEILDRTGDKLSARRLANECGVQVLPGTLEPLSDVEQARKWISEDGHGLPAMIKAADGGGGRGIRLVREEKDLQNLVERAMADSPSHQVFIEKAAVDNFRHIEVQIIGDGTGQCTHLWERECSIQRRYQKIVELAPSTVSDRLLVSKIIEAAVKMAEKVKYFSLGTFEFLANDKTGEYYFLEVNPRLQVEHTITEEVAGGVDVVQLQLELAEGSTFSTPETLSLPLHLIQHEASAQPPARHSIQLRITAENPKSDFSLSIGRISSFHLPNGPGVRVETALVHGHPGIVSPDFDSLLAKIIVTSSSWTGVVKKAQRVLLDTRITGVVTNLDVLRGIVSSEAFASGACDTTWLEKNIDELVNNGQHVAQGVDSSFFNKDTSESTQANSTGLTSSTVLFRKNDAWEISLIPNFEDRNGDAQESNQTAATHHMKLTKVLRNEFPNLLYADIEYTCPSSSGSPHNAGLTANSNSSISGSDAYKKTEGDSAVTRKYKLKLNSTTATSSSSMSNNTHPRGDAGNPRHITSPFAGKLIELLIDEGDTVSKGDVVGIIQQMKMELEVRAARSGRVKWVCEVAEGDYIADGTLLAELEEEDEEWDKGGSDDGGSAARQSKL